MSVQVSSAGERPLVIPVILSGGAGTRLWPLSTEEKPKQFHALGGEHTMLQATALRFVDTPQVRFAPPAVICSRKHEALVAEQLAAVGVTPSAVVLEPVGRNTAAAAVLASEVTCAVAPDALTLLLPADHVVRQPEAFREAVAAAAGTGEGRIVTFGIRPDRPETGYGYIKAGEPLGHGLHAVAQFTEKPGRDLAERYLADGGYAWNAGIFLFGPEVLLAEMGRHRPDILDGARAAWRAARKRGAVYDLDEQSFAACPSESVDIAVMEPTDHAAVLPCEIGWADVGSWSEIWRLGSQDSAGDLLRGSVAALESPNALVWAEGLRVGVLGLEDAVVVAVGDAVLVTTRERAQDVKGLVEALRQLGSGASPR